MLNYSFNLVFALLVVFVKDTMIVFSHAKACERWMCIHLHCFHVVGTHGFFFLLKSIITTHVLLCIPVFNEAQ